MVHRVWKSFLKLRCVSSLESTLDAYGKDVIDPKWKYVQSIVCSRGPLPVFLTELSVTGTQMQCLSATDLQT